MGPSILYWNLTGWLSILPLECNVLLPYGIEKIITDEDVKLAHAGRKKIELMLSSSDGSLQGCLCKSEE